MNISVRGKGGLSSKEVRYATRYFVEAMLGPRLSKHVSVQILFNIKSGDGSCFPTEDSYRPRMFEIELNPKMGRLKTLTALAHEIVHLKQYARGELREMCGRGAKWNGKLWKIKKDDYISYLFWPWEIEAYGTEKALSLVYRVHLKKENIKFA